MFQEEDEEQDGIWKKLLELFECNGIKQQFEKQVSKVGIKICGENRGKKKHRENWGRGKGDEWWESSISNEKVKVYKRNFSQDPWKLRDWMGKRGKREVLWCKCRWEKKFSFRIRYTKAKKFANNKKIQENLSLHFFLNVKSFEIRSNLYQFELNESNIKNLLYRLSYDNLVL